MKQQVIEIIMEEYGCNRKDAEKVYNSMSYYDRKRLLDNDAQNEMMAWC